MNEEEKELLVQIALTDGSLIEFYKKGTDVSLCRADHCVILPKASAQKTAELYAILEDLGKTILEDENGNSE